MDAESPISHSDVTAIMGLLADIRDDISFFRKLIEGTDEEEEEDPEADA